jgi:hypothetical protein
MCRAREFGMVRRFQGRKETRQNQLKPDCPATSKTDLNMEKWVQMVGNDC